MLLLYFKVGVKMNLKDRLTDEEKVAKKIIDQYRHLIPTKLPDARKEEGFISFRKKPDENRQRVTHNGVKYTVMDTFYVNKTSSGHRYCKYIIKFNLTGYVMIANALQINKIKDPYYPSTKGFFCMGVTNTDIDDKLILRLSRMFYTITAKSQRNNITNIEPRFRIRSEFIKYMMSKYSDSEILTGYFYHNSQTSITTVGYNRHASRVPVGQGATSWYNKVKTDYVRSRYDLVDINRYPYRDYIPVFTIPNEFNIHSRPREDKIYEAANKHNGKYVILGTQVSPRKDRPHEKLIQFLDTGNIVIANRTHNTTVDNWAPSVRNIGCIGDRSISRNPEYHFLYEKWIKNLKYAGSLEIDPLLLVCSEFIKLFTESPLWSDFKTKRFTLRKINKKEGYTLDNLEICF